MISIRKAVALLDLCYGYDYTGPLGALDIQLDAVDLTALREPDAWPTEPIEPRLLDWLPPCRDVVIAQDVDLWLYKIESLQMWYHPTVSGPNDEFDALPRCNTLERAQLLCEQHRRLRRATAATVATTSGG